MVFIIFCNIIFCIDMKKESGLLWHYKIIIPQNIYRIAQGIHNQLCKAGRVNNRLKGFCKIIKIRVTLHCIKKVSDSAQLIIVRCCRLKDIAFFLFQQIFAATGTAVNCL